MDITNSIAPGLQNIGIVTSELFSDINNGNLLNLIVCGKYMPITIYKNKGGKFENITSKHH